MLNRKRNHQKVTPAEVPEPMEQQRQQEEDAQELRQVGGAAVAGGLAGLVLVGPMFGLVAAGGAAVAATTPSKAGQVARAAGDVTASAGDRLKEFDKKHHLTKKTKQGAQEVGRSLKKFDDKHHVVRKTTNSVKKGCDWVSNKLKDSQGRSPRNVEETLTS